LTGPEAPESVHNQRPADGASPWPREVSQEDIKSSPAKAISVISEQRRAALTGFPASLIPCCDYLAFKRFIRASCTARMFGNQLGGTRYNRRPQWNPNRKRRQRAARTDARRVRRRKKNSITASPATAWQWVACKPRRPSPPPSHISTFRSPERTSYTSPDLITSHILA